MSGPTKESGIGLQLATLLMRLENGPVTPIGDRILIEGDLLRAVVAERDALQEAAQALVTARAEGARIEPWGALIAALERHQ